MRRVAFVVILAACAEPDHWSFSSRPIEGEGTTVVVVWISDSPVDAADEFFVTFDSVELRGARDVILASAPQRVELLSLRNGRRARLAVAEAPAGTYESLVLRLSSSPGSHHLTSRGEARALAVADPVVEIEGPFDVRDGTELLVDFNARMSVVGGELRPVCAAADLATARFLEGLVMDEAGCPVEGAVVSAQNGGFEVCSGRTDADGNFRLGPVEAGATVVATGLGRGIATGTGVLTLPPAETGELSGTVDAGLYVRLVRDGAMVAVADVDGGAYSFPEVPPGAYELEVWGRGGLLEVHRVVR